ncbi:hypothetical protein BKA56DRAFT_585523 [Ilyonectria sp. MPI-CAGE-AT-0026]|nr:hypothetical protein BKA56DRAFT_585523 [Ilyonectria sp. MPI-CAGE-AT-0026]
MALTCTAAFVLPWLSIPRLDGSRTFKIGLYSSFLLGFILITIAFAIPLRKHHRVCGLRCGDWSPLRGNGVLGHFAPGSCRFQISDPLHCPGMAFIWAALSGIPTEILPPVRQ